MTLDDIPQLFVDRIGAPVAKVWARLTGLPGRVLACMLVFTAALISIAGERDRLLDRSPTAWMNVGLTMLAVMFLVTSIEEQGDGIEGEVRVRPRGDWYLRWVMVMDLVFGVYDLLVSMFGHSRLDQAGYAACISTGCAVALARQGRARSVVADLFARITSKAPRLASERT